jgi:hydrogenase maturation protease
MPPGRDGVDRLPAGGAGRFWRRPPPEVAARIPVALGIARDVLQGWGVEVSEGRTASDLLADPAIRREAYEAGRPSAEEACRTGDQRFFPERR